MTANSADAHALRKMFVESALQAEQEIVAGSEVYSMESVHRYLRDRLAGVEVTRPEPMLE